MNREKIRDTIKKLDSVTQIPQYDSGKKLSLPCMPDTRGIAPRSFVSEEIRSGGPKVKGAVRSPVFKGAGSPHRLIGARSMIPGEEEPDPDAFMEVKEFFTLGLDTPKDFSYAEHEDSMGLTYESSEPEKQPELTKEEFVSTLTELLNTLPHYGGNVEIQSIKRQERTRIPINVVTFLYGASSSMIGKMYIKDYSGKDDLTRRKDTVIPAYLSKLGIPTATVIGFDPREKEYRERYAFLQQPFRDQVLLDRTGIDDFAEILEELKDQRVVENSLKIIDLMAKMHVRGTKNLEILKSEYGLELEETDYMQLVDSRLIDHLALEKNEKLVRKFHDFYCMIEKRSRAQKTYMQHADFTINQIRVGGNLDNYFLLDWELTRRGAPCAEDLAMFTLCILRAKPGLDRKSTEEIFAERYSKAFSRFSSHEQHEFPVELDEMVSRMRVEILRGHLYKMGDQIWTQDRFGESPERRGKAQHHLRQFCKSAENIGIFSEEQKRLFISSVLSLVSASPKLQYLREPVHDIKNIYRLN